MRKINIPLFGSRLREAFNGKSNAEIARLLGVSDAAINNYIKGRLPTNDVIDSILDLTGCSAHWLLTGEGLRHASSADLLTIPQIESLKMLSADGDWEALAKLILTEGIEQRLQPQAAATELPEVFKDMVRQLIREEVQRVIADELNKTISTHK